MTFGWILLTSGFLLGSPAGMAQSAAAGTVIPPQFAGYQAKTDCTLSEILSNLIPQPTAPNPKTATFELLVAAGATMSEMPASDFLRPAPFREDPATAFAERFWNGRADSLNDALKRLNRIRPSVDRILAEEGVPTRWAAVALIESGGDPWALSPKAARGLWQFIPATAERYGLIVSDQQDDRVDLFKSTRAAARYLRDLYRMFGDWRLVLAAYNAGEGALREAIRRAGSYDFRLLSERRFIPAETRSYVPAVLAAANLLDRQASSATGPADDRKAVEVRP